MQARIRFYHKVSITDSISTTTCFSAFLISAGDGVAFVAAGLGGGLGADFAAGLRTGFLAMVFARRVFLASVAFPVRRKPSAAKAEFITSAEGILIRPAVFPRSDSAEGGGGARKLTFFAGDGLFFASAFFWMVFTIGATDATVFGGGGFFAGALRGGGAFFGGAAFLIALVGIGFAPDREDLGGMYDSMGWTGSWQGKRGFQKNDKRRRCVPWNTRYLGVPRKP